MRPLTIYILLGILFVLPLSGLTADDLILTYQSDKDSIPTGVPLPVKGKRVDSDTMPTPTTQSWLQPPIVTKAHANVSSASPTIGRPILEKPIPRVHGENGFPPARTIAVKGKVVPAKQGQRVFALPPQNQNIHGINLKILNEDHGMQSDALQTLLQDSKGHIWIGTMGKGMIRYDGTFFSHFGVDEGLSGDFVTDIIEDKQGNLWITTQDGGISCFDGQSFRHFTETEGLTRSDTYSIVEDRVGNLWIAGGWELMRISPGSQNNTTTLTFFLPENTVLDLLLDSKGHLWIGVHEGGVWHFDGNFFRHYTEREGFTNQTVRQIKEDRSGNIWLGTLDGLFKFNGRFFTLIDDVTVLLGRNISTIEEDSKGNLWIGSLEGICYYDGKQFECFNEETGFSHNLISDILEDEQGQIWIATPMGLNLIPEQQFYHYYERNGLQAAQVSSIVEDSAGALWFSSFRGGVSRYDGQFFTQWTQLQGLASNQVGTIFEDQIGRIWIGTNEGLYQFHENGFTHFTTKEGLNGNHISAMINDREGNMWIGTYDGGLCKYDQRSFTQFTSEHGLSDDFVSSIFEDREGRLWLGTRDGFEVVQTLKKDERSCHIPIILLTAKADLSSKLEGLAHGADAYLSKPFDEHELQIRLQKLIELRQQLEKRYRSFPNLGHVPTGQSLDNIFLTKLRTTVEEHLEEEDFGVEQLCRALAVSRTQLHRKLKALTGQSTTRIMRRIRLEKAKKLLRNSDLTISEIGYAVGIASRSYFTQIFKEEYGESPGYFRKT